MNFYSKNSGVTALPMLLIISGILVEIIVAIALVAYLLSSSGLAERFAAQATVIANAGIQDAAMKITRNKDLSDTDYSLGVGNNVANVQIWKNVGVGGGAATGKYRVVSTGTVRVFQKRLEAVYIVNDDTGEVELESYREMTF